MVSPTVYVSEEVYHVDIAPVSSLQGELRDANICPTLTVMLIRSIG